MTIPQAFQPPTETPDRLADPYPGLARLRSFAGPMAWAQQHWIVLGHAEAMAVLRDSSLVSSQSADGAAQDQAAGARRAYRRDLMRQAITPELAERFRPRVQERADALLGQMAAGAQVDLMAAFAVPLALSAASDLMGFQGEQGKLVNEWVAGITSSLAPAFGHRMQPGGRPVVPPDEVRDAVAALIAAHRSAPQDDLTGLLAEVAGPEGKFGDDELLDVCVELLVSAHLSTVDMIGNGAHSLMANPSEAERLREQPDLIVTAVEELLRFEPPILRIIRFATQDVELAGNSVAAGQTVLVMVGAANRDPEVFEGPDVLDLSRTPNPHLSFGRGTRFCLGAPVARMVAQVAISSLVSRFPAARPAGQPEWRKVLGARGLDSLPVAL